MLKVLVSLSALFPTIAKGVVASFQRRVACMKRRSFILGFGAAAVLCPMVYGSFQGRMFRGGINSGSLKRIRRTARHFGTDVSITLVHHDIDSAQRTIESAFSTLDRVESVMSLYRSDSEITLLNRDRGLSNPHPYLVSVLRAAQEVSKRTAGAFDVTVQPLWELYEESAERGRLPDRSELVRVQRSVGWEKIKISEDRIEILDEGTAVTLNGIGQGFAADLVRDLLRDSGALAALIDTGEFSSFGRKESGDDFRIGIKHPREQGRLLALADLSDRCLATSGDYETHFSDDYRLHHIVDPKTGVSPTELASVSVLASTALEADALSTAMMVMGAKRGKQLAESRPDIEALFVTKDGKIERTNGFPLVEVV